MTFTMTYDDRNKKAIAQLGDKTKALAWDWYNYCIANSIDILITETIRTVEEQKADVAKGASQTMKSYHLIGQALDFVPVTAPGVIDYNAYKKSPYDKALAYAKKIGFQWGGDWTTFKDMPHLENDIPYGSDTFNTRGQLPPNVKVAEQPKPVPASTPSTIKAIGQIKIVGVSNAAVIMDTPDRNNAKNVGTINLGATISISGSVIGKNNGSTGYYEVIYQNKRCYVSAQYGKKI